MMIAISKLPDVVNEHGEIIKSTVNEQIFWRDLPNFAFYFREVALCECHWDMIFYPNSYYCTPILESFHPEKGTILKLWTEHHAL